MCRNASVCLPWRAYSFPKLRLSCDRRLLLAVGFLRMIQFPRDKCLSACLRELSPRLTSANSRRGGTSSMCCLPCTCCANFRDCRAPGSASSYCAFCRNFDASCLVRSTNADKLSSNVFFRRKRSSSVPVAEGFDRSGPRRGHNLCIIPVHDVSAAFLEQ